MTLMLVNPAKRPTKRAAGAVKTHPAPARRAAGKSTALTKTEKSLTTARKALARLRKNPATKPMGMIKPALVGAAGAIAVNAAVSYLPLPASLKTGVAGHAVKGAAAIGLGLLASKFTKSQLATEAAQGALTVAATNALQGLIKQAIPSFPLGDADEEIVVAGVDGMGEYYTAEEVAGMDAAADTYITVE